MHASIINGVTILSELIRIQNHWNETHGTEIKRNNKDIWAILNDIDNDDWFDIFLVWQLFIEQQRPWIRDDQRRALELAIQRLNKGITRGDDRIMDQPGHQTTAWRCVMVMREIYNTVAGVEWHQRPQRTRAGWSLFDTANE